MNDEAALLAQIRATPDDDTLKLVYADALDERNGPDDARIARIIRAECEARRVDSTNTKARSAGGRSWGRGRPVAAYRKLVMAGDWWRPGEREAAERAMIGGDFATGVYTIEYGRILTLLNVVPPYHPTYSGLGRTARRINTLSDGNTVAEVYQDGEGRWVARRPSGGLQWPGGWPTTIEAVLSGISQVANDSDAPDFGAVVVRVL